MLHLNKIYRKYEIILSDFLHYDKFIFYRRQVELFFRLCFSPTSSLLVFLSFVIFMILIFLVTRKMELTFHFGVNFLRNQNIDHHTILLPCRRHLH